MMVVACCSVLAHAQSENVVRAPGAPTRSSQTSPEKRTLEGQPEISDEQRSALTITSYDLQVQLKPAQSGLAALARLVVRNDSRLLLQKVPLQISSSLHWDAASTPAGQTVERLPLEQHLIDTDADHTGVAEEAILQLQAPLRPGQAMELTLAYSGTVERSANRLTRAGIAQEQASAADWDTMSAASVSLRGFGNVLWYPVAARQAFLEDGARLKQMIGTQQGRERSAAVRLRLSIEGKPPAFAVFCGRRSSVTVVDHGSAQEQGSSAYQPALSTAEWSAAPLGFGPLSLFTREALPQTDGGPLTVEGGTPDQVSELEAEARSTLPFMNDWLGGSREREPIVVDHAGEPFSQGALMVAPADQAANPLALAPLESHAWFSSPEEWLDEGVADLLALLVVEQQQGRAAALSYLHDVQPALSLADSSEDTVGRGEPLTRATSDVFRRNKAVSVLWMLRSLTSDSALKSALRQLKQEPEAERTAQALEHALESASGKDLQWFFQDWVYEDHGLPDLSIVSAKARPFTGVAGRQDGNLVAVDVRNDGHAAAEVPVTVRSGSLTATERVRVPAVGVASVRILFQGIPEVVEVNDGTVPEIGSSTHQLQLVHPQ